MEQLWSVSARSQLDSLMYTDQMNKISGFFKWLFKSRIRILIVIVLIIVVGFFGYRNFSNKSTQPQYQTSAVEKGSLIKSISASGQVTTANNVQVTIQSSGVVKDVFVKNGDKVSQGQNIAALTLDQASQQKNAAALASYLSSKSSLDAATAKFNSLQATEFTANQKFINDAVAAELTTDNPTYIIENANWLQAEADYKNQQAVVAASQASLASSSLALSQTSPTITAPVSGIVKGLTIVPGAIVTVTSSGTNSTSTSQVLGSIYQEGPIQALVNVSEIDSVSAEEGQKVTMSLDAFPDLTFTGKIVSINTNGVSSSGVTTYPAVVIFDSGNDKILPNMAVSAKIITKVDEDVLLVPSAAVQTNNGSSSVRFLKNNNPVSVPVEVGDSNDTETEVTGVKEGDEVITGSTSTARSTTTTGATSPFGGGGFGGGRAVFGGAGGGGGAGAAARGGR